MSPPRPLTPSGGTAKTLILIGLILQGIEVLFILGIGAITLVFLIGFFLIIAGVLGIVWLVVVYLLSYQRVVEGRYEEAKTPTLIVAILSLITFNLISGILYIIAYVKLGDAVREAQTSLVAPPPLGFSPSPYAAPSTRMCLGCGRVLPSPTPAFCPACGKQVPA